VTSDEPATRLLGERGAVTAGGRLPLWYQVMQVLRLAILTRDPAEGARLPTEAQLADQYRVSLATLRQALAVLEDEGLIERHRRRGTFIRGEVPRRRRLEVAGSLDTVISQQAAEDVRVLDIREVDTPAELAERFRGEPHLVAVRRLRFEHGEPVSYAENFVIPRWGRHLTAEGLSRGSVTETLRRALGVPIARIEETAEAHLATPEIAQRLAVDLLSPILFCTGLTYDTDGAIVDAAFLYYRGDRFTFAVNIDVS